MKGLGVMTPRRALVVITALAAAVSVAVLLAGGQDSPSSSHAFELQVSMAELVKDSDAVIIGKVSSIAQPRWNSEDGSDWRDEIRTGDNFVGSPTLLTDIVIDVEEVIYQASKEDLAVDPIVSGSSVQITVAGDPSKPFTESSSPLPTFAQRYPLQPDERRVFFLAQRNIILKRTVGPLVWWGHQGTGAWAFSSEGVAFPTVRYMNEEIRKRGLPIPTTPVVVDSVTTGFKLGELRRVIDNLPKS